ncbi:MAG: Type 1 glutamine amidotransferase-like domain-containing protein [Microgenomates group bacterium]
MKRLFLSSYFAFVADLLLPLLPKPPREMKLAFIPTAADPYLVKPWFYGDKMKLQMMGFQMKDVDLKNKTQEQLESELGGMDAVFISGGNTYYLLDKVQKSGFDRIVKNLVTKGMVYIGSSAGSALACPTIEHIEDFDDKSIVALTSYDGLHLTDTLLLPHYGEAKYEQRFTGIVKKWKEKGHELLLLRNSEVLVVNNDKEKVQSI